jgi:hypothetical protein
VVGHLPKDKHTGKLIDVWTSAMAESGLAQVDINNGVADLLACKDANEVRTAPREQLRGLLRQQKRLLAWSECQTAGPKAFLSFHGLQLLRPTNSFSLLQILNVKKAALLAAKAMQNWVVPKVEDVVDSGAE